MSGHSIEEFIRLIALETLALSAGHVAAIASAAERHAAPSVAATRAIMDAVPHDGVRPIARRLAEAWERVYDVASGRPDGPSIALALRVAISTGTAALGEQSVDIVWTGPSTKDVPPRLTPAVIEELACLSRQTLWVVSFAAYKVPRIVAALGAAATRGVNVRLLLETKDDSRGALTFDAASEFVAIRDQVDVYVWPRDKRPHIEGGHAAMHAKAVIADGAAAFVTSANLTGNALEENMELGLLVRGGTTPRRLALHYERLLEAGVLRRIDQ